MGGGGCPATAPSGRPAIEALGYGLADPLP